MAKVAKVRIKNKKLLEESAWRFFDCPDVRADILEGGKVAFVRRKDRYEY